MYIKLNILLLVIAIGVNCEWIPIEQNSKSVGDHVLTIDRSLLQVDVNIKKDLDNLKYEDLIDIIGPGFEEDFVKYLHEHRNEVIKNSYISGANIGFIGGNKSNITTSMQLILSDFFKKNASTVERRPNKQEFFADPWAIYDKPINSISDKRTWAKFSQPGPNGYTTTVMPVTLPSVFSTVSSTKKSTLNPTNKPEASMSTRSPPKEQQSMEVTSKQKASLENPPIKLPINETIQKVKTVKQKIVLKQMEFTSYNPFDFSSIINFFKDIQKTFLFGTARGLGDKIKFLDDFKNQMLVNIEKRLQKLWPTNVNQSRQKRGLLDKENGSGGGGHGMGFPSTEVALMTISFLTFAVFVIKLVLLVIHTIKSKHYGFNTLQPMTSPQAEPPIKIIKKYRNARKLSLSVDDLRILTTTISSIENLKIT